MPSYSGTADMPSKAKAIVAVAAVHALLAVAILTGLNVGVVSQVVERLQTIDVRLAPPAPEPPPPARQPNKVELEEGAAGKKADPSPIVAPQPRVPVQSPLPAAPVAGSGSATTAGAATTGRGTGAGGSGAGRGGDGDGDTSGFTPARRISRIPDREYRQLSATGLESGQVGVTIKVNVDGRVTNCRVARSSGDGTIDALMCRLTLSYIRFAPARDAAGRPVAQDVTFFPNWWRPAP